MSLKALPQLSKEDLSYVFTGIDEKDWGFFSNKRIFITGGTGFLGKWLISALLEANKRLTLQLEIVILTRSPARFHASAPHLASAREVSIHHGEIRSFEPPPGDYDIVIHGATDVVAQASPLETFDTCVEGTRRVLNFARAAKAQDLLLMSSGAVYGVHPSRPTGLSEQYSGGPDPTLTKSAYGEGKRVSEWLVSYFGEAHNIRTKIARIYAQVGPYLPMDKHFAIGNFIIDALANRDILIKGDGRPYRSYMYTADTTIWFLAMLTRGRAGRAWNGGGADGIAIRDLALKVASLIGSSRGVKIMTPIDPKNGAECYVPDVTRARAELGVPSPIDLETAILRTAAWLKNNKVFTE